MEKASVTGFLPVEASVIGTGDLLEVKEKANSNGNHKFRQILIMLHDVQTCNVGDDMEIAPLKQIAVYLNWDLSSRRYR